MIRSFLLGLGTGVILTLVALHRRNDAPIENWRVAAWQPVLDPYLDRVLRGNPS